MPTEEDATNQVVNQQQISITTESQFVNAKLHSNVELQNEENAHFDSEIRTHERDVEIPERDEHSDTKAERQNIAIRTQPRLSKYVKRHHPTDQIIGEKDTRRMIRNRLRSESCLFRMKKPKKMKDTLEDDDWYKAMEEEIQQIEKNKTQILVPRLEDKNVIGTK